MRASKSSHLILEDVQVRLRQHCELQDEERGARSGDGEKPLRNPPNKICAVHVCIPVVWIEQTTECAARRCATNALSDRLLSKS